MHFPGMNLRVTAHRVQGGRRYMEDEIMWEYVESPDGRQIEIAYFAVFDGHGGAEAANFAMRHLRDEITKHKGFWSNDDVLVMKAIKDGFNSTHRLMWKDVGSWPKTLSGLPSTSGSTASIVFIKEGKMYVGHVGDSGIVMGIKYKHFDALRAHCVTVDHKPDCPKERKRIESNGGQVVAKAGVHRVVWNRPKPNHQGPVRRSTHIDKIPFLAVARSLGDLWSYNSEQDVFVVSPEPDVCTYKLDLRKHHCLILASDGLWNMIKPQEAISIVDEMEREWQRNKKNDHEAIAKKPAVALVHMALERWSQRCLRADNTSAIVVWFDPPLDKPPTPYKTSPCTSTTSLHSAQVSPSNGSDGEEHNRSSSDCESESDDDENFRQDLEDIDLGDDDEEVGDAELAPPWETMTDKGGRVRSHIGTNKLPSHLNRNHLSLKCQRPLLKRTPPHPIYTGIRPLSPKSAPPKLATCNPFTKLCQNKISSGPSTPKSSIVQTENPSEGSSCKVLHPHGLFEKLKCSSPGADASTDKNTCQSSLRTPRQRRHSHSDSTGSPSTSPNTRCLRSRSSPRQVGSNLTNNTGSPAKSISSSSLHAHAVCEPKEATSARSPLKVDTNNGRLGSPSSGLVSPIWPSCLEVGMEVEVASVNMLPKHSLLAKMNLQQPGSSTCLDNDTEQGSTSETENENITTTSTVSPSCGVKRKGSPHSTLRRGLKKPRSGGATPTITPHPRPKSPACQTYNTRAHLHKLSPTKVAC